MTIAVFGATGELGSYVLVSLIKRGVPASMIRAVGRDGDKLAGLAARGFETVRVDYDDPSTLTAAVADLDRLLLISGSQVGQRIAQHTAVIDAAKAAGVGFLVYTSAPHADTTDLVLAPEHKATEEALNASGLHFAVLRNNWYTENYRADFDRIRQGGVIANSIGAGRIASAPRADYADAAAAVLTTDGHGGKIYELGGDEAWSFEEFAAAAAKTTGVPVSYRTLIAEDELKELGAAGLPDGTVDFIVALNKNIRDGDLAETTGELSKLIGHPTETLAETLASWV